MARTRDDEALKSPCPVCPARFAEVDEAWRDHVAGEHPEAWATLRRAVRAGKEGARERARIRQDLTRALDEAARLLAEHRTGHPAA